MSKCSPCSKRKRLWQKKKQAAPVCMSNNSFLFQSWRHLIGYCVVFECKLFLLKLHGSVSHKTFIEAKWGFNVSKWTVYLLCAVHPTFCSNAALRTSMSKQTCLFQHLGSRADLVKMIYHYACITVDCHRIHNRTGHPSWLCLLIGKMLACLFIIICIFSCTWA